MYEMEYKGGIVESVLSPVTFDEKYYNQYKDLLSDCFCEMRKSLHVKPFKAYYSSLDELLKQKENIFLLIGRNEIICAISCLENEIEKLAVNLKYHRQGYGRKLTEFALSYMQKRGDYPIKLTVAKWNKKAISLYLSLDFIITKEATITGVNSKDPDGNFRFKIISTGGLNIR